MRDEHGGDAARAWLTQLSNLILETAIGVVGFHAATATIRDNDTPTTIATTDQSLVALDDAQYASGEGPCVDTLEPTGAVIWTESNPNPRWNSFQAAAAQAGVAMSLSLHVLADEAEELAASLTFYTHAPRQLEPRQLDAAQRFAAQLAAALHGAQAHNATSRHAANLTNAMHTRATIEQAKGILISERRLTPDQAFALLSKMSQDTNTKLHDLAQQLIHTRAPTRHT